MTGFQSKKMMAHDRYCDPITMDHLIEIKKQLSDAERERDNALDVVMMMVQERRMMIELIDRLETMLREYQKGFN